MAIALEIKDGSPHWYLSPDIWTVGTPSEESEITPIAGSACYLKAKVRNEGNTGVQNATVKFYWANPAVGFNRNTATYIGQSFVSLDANQIKDVLCLVPWTPEYLNNGHECILAEAFHQNDPLINLTDFNVPTDRHVAQRNLSVAVAKSGRFHMNFEIHNAFRTEQKFEIQARQISSKELSGFHHIPKLIKGKKEGRLNTIDFSQERCLSAGVEFKGAKECSKKGVTVEGYKTKHMAINGGVSGDFALVMITQLIDKKVTGGLVVVVINDKKEKNDTHTSKQ